MLKKEISFKNRIVSAILVLVMSLTSFIGTTFAWFTDSVTSGSNVIKSGNLDANMYYSDELLDASDSNWKNADGVPVFTHQNWEPGYTEVKYVKIENAGDLAFKWMLSIEAGGEVGILADVIDVYYVNPVNTELDSLNGLTSSGNLTDVIAKHTSTNGVILPEGKTEQGLDTGAVVLAIAMHMQESAGNKYQDETVCEEGFLLKLVATQYNYEKDSYDDSYDKDATWDDITSVGSVKVPVTTNAAGELTSSVTGSFADGAATYTLPAGMKFKPGTTEATVSISNLANESNLSIENGEERKSIDVHVDGVADDNTVAAVIEIGEALPKGLNLGNYKLYHFEEGVANQMMLASLADVDAHNEFAYDPVTGNVTVAMATYSEVALVADTENAWNGTYATAFAGGDGTEENPYIIANADQLAYLSAIVGGMLGHTQNSFAGKTIKLVNDINLGDKESENNPDIIFYPIGYYNSEGTYERTNTAINSGLRIFEGTFDGNGNTVANFYQNTWEMKGDHNWYTPEEQYYRDGMGLFGRVYKGTVKNLTVKNFSSDGEIATTGVIAAYADGATFENIAIFNCNPKVYNIGNGGIVGCVGWYAKEADLKTTFKNITVDNSNKISALWGSYDVACGGIVGQYYPTSGQTSAGTPKNAGIDFKNCHISAVMDVYNDVCANYQYYAYRYTGMLIGSVRENETIDGHVYPKMDGITASGCTVHFGTWNDYYYCEIIDNTTASYTHDYQMSRLTEIKAIDGTTITYLDGTTGTVPASGRANYVIVDYTKGHGTDNATCYHFKDGAVWTHDMGGIQTGIDENGDGKDDLKEDKQHIYLEFNNLVTGYGWGVTTKGVGDLAGVTILDREVGNSVEKFEGTNVTTIPNKIAISIADLFKAIEGVDAKIINGALHVGIKNLDENGTVTAEFARDVNNWANSTIKITGTGNIAITIQDYYFCTPTTITVNVVEASEYKMFDLVFKNTDKYLYRVGNSNNVGNDNDVKIDSLFKSKLPNTTQGNDLRFSASKITSNNVSAKLASDKSYINFDNTGVVKITIGYGESKDTELNLEVVNATNTTSAIGATNKNIVLLSDVTFSNTYLYYKNATVYGNGFTIDITGADHSDLKDTSDTSSNKSAYTNIWMVDSVFNNVRVIGSVYPKVGMTADSDYGNAAIRTEGECLIAESYISNCRVPLRVQGNTTLIDTVVDGGRYANIELRFGKLTLDGVTTINTVRKGSDDTTDVIGFGIVVHDEASTASISVIGDGLKQYNWVGEEKHKAILSKDTYLSSAYKLIFNSNNSDSIYFSKDGDRYVNTGILCLSADLKAEDIVTGLDDRYYQKVNGYDAWVLTYDKTKHTAWFDESIEEDSVTYTPEQYPITPDFSGNESQTVEFTNGETYYFDTSVLTAKKFGGALDISSVTMNGVTYNYGDKIAITKGGEYDIVYTVDDPYNYDASASIQLTIQHNITVKLTAIVKDAEILAPKFTFIDQNGNEYESTTVKVGDKTYVMPNVTEADPTTNAMSSINIGSASISGTTVYFPIATGYTVRSGSNFNRYYPLFNGINITDYTIAGDKTGTTYKTGTNYTSLVGSSGTKFIIPANSTQNSCGDYVKTTGQSGNPAGNSDSGWQGAGYSTSYGGTYLKSGNTNASNGSDKNGYERIVWVEYCFNAGNGSVYYYRIGYHCNKESAQTCITPDTLITLADGSQVRVDSLTGNEMLLVWNMETGKFDVAPIMFVDSDATDEFEVIYLTFSDGTVVKVIGEHGFWDYDLNRYVYLDKDAADYIGHTFAKHNGDKLEQVQLVDVVIETELTEAWSPVTVGHLCYFVNGMLSMPGGVGGLFNIFEVDPETMMYDYEQLEKDIETYGLYTYEELNAICPLSEEMFNAAGGAYLKISIGKGNLTEEELFDMINRYSKFFE